MDQINKEIAKRVSEWIYMPTGKHRRGAREAPQLKIISLLLL